jgi:hypothetical protein
MVNHGSLRLLKKSIWSLAYIVKLPICNIILLIKQYENKGCFTTGLATQFLSCNDHLQTHYISTPMNVIKQVAYWIEKDAIHYIYDDTLMQFIAT